MEAKNKLAVNEKYCKKLAAFYQPEFVKVIHSRTKPQQFNTIIQPKAKICQPQSYMTEPTIFEKRGIKTNRRRLYSSKKVCEVT